MNYLSLDIGTTCCKCQLFSETGKIIDYISREYGFKNIDGKSYVDIETVWKLVCEMISTISIDHDISSICISSMGESFVLLDKDDNILFHPMLYTDARGEEEAKKVSALIGEEKMFSVTGVLPHSMYSIYKLLWIKNNYPKQFELANKVLLVGEYIGYLLTGKCVIDYALASRTGVFDIEKKIFSTEILYKLGVDATLFSTPKLAGSIVGEIKSQLIIELGIKGNPVLVLGSHDQVCTALGAGVLEDGDSVDGMGTVECITTLFKDKPTSVKMGRQGYPCVPYVIDGKYCTYILNFSCGSTVNWFKNIIMHGYSEDKDNYFTYIEEDLPEGPSGVLVLPYFGGASTPFNDISAKGAIIGLKTETTDHIIYKAIMEGTAMEMRLNAQAILEYGIMVTSAVATGGCANSDKWMQIKADIQKVPYKVLRSSEGGLCGCAMLQAVALKGVADLFEARDVFVRYKKEFTPNFKQTEKYQNQYLKYEKLYNTLKEFN